MLEILFSFCLLVGFIAVLVTSCVNKVPKEEQKGKKEGGSFINQRSTQGGTSAVFRFDRVRTQQGARIYEDPGMYIHLCENHRPAQASRCHSHQDVNLLLDRLFMHRRTQYEYQTSTMSLASFSPRMCHMCGFRW